MTLNGRIDLGGPGGSSNRAFLGFGTISDTAGQTLSGTGSVVFGADDNGDVMSISNPNTLTIGSGITVQGGQLSFITGPLDNQGTIKEDTAGGTLYLNDYSNGPAWTNDGTAEASNGGTLNLGGQGWVNNGSLSATGATLNLDNRWVNNGSVAADATSTLGLGSPNVSLDPTTDPNAPSYVWSDLGRVSAAPGTTVNLGGVFQTAALAGLGLDAADTVNLTGTLDNSGTTLVLGSRGTPGSWNLLGGRVFRGDIATANGAALAGTFYDGTLDGVRLDGTLDLAQNLYARATVLHGMVLNGQVLLGGLYGSYVQFGNDSEGTDQTLSGTGSVVFGTDSSPNYLQAYNPYSLTIGPRITIQGGQQSFLVGHFDNQGSIREDTAGGTLYVNAFGAAWTNEGTAAASNGGTLNLGGQGWVNNGTLSAAGATLNLDDRWTNYGSVAADATSTLGLGSPYINIDPTSTDVDYRSRYGWDNLSTVSAAHGATVNLGGVFPTGEVAGLGLSASDIVNLTGTLDNRASTLALGSSATPGSWNLQYGRIFQGGVSTANGTALVGTQFGGTLDGVRLDGTLDLTQISYASAAVLNGLLLNGSIEGGQQSSVTGDINSQGTIEDKTAGGYLYIDGDQLANYAAGTLTGGTWGAANGATLQLNNAPITTNGATFLLDGATARVYSDSYNTDAFAGLTTNAAGASLTVTHGASLSTAASLSNAGALVVGPGSSVRIGGDYTQAASGALGVAIGGSQAGQ